MSRECWHIDLCMHGLKGRWLSVTLVPRKACVDCGIFSSLKANVLWLDHVGGEEEGNVTECARCNFMRQWAPCNDDPRCPEAIVHKRSMAMVEKTYKYKPLQNMLSKGTTLEPIRQVQWTPKLMTFELCEAHALDFLRPTRVA